MTGGGLCAAAIGAAAAMLAFAALHDVAFRTVPDWVSAAVASAGCVLRLSDRSLPEGLGCGAAVFASAALCWRRGWLGGADVKLLAAAAVLVPPAAELRYVASVAVTGGGLALIYLALEQAAPRPAPRRGSLARRLLAVECRRIRRRSSVPYAAAICSGALLTLAKG